MDESPHKDLKKSYTKYLEKYLEKYESTLTKKELDYLISKVKKAIFMVCLKYINVKNINEACSISNTNYVELKAPDNLPFRPIVAGPICETYRLSILIDILLQPYSKHVKSLFFQLSGRHVFQLCVLINSKPTHIKTLGKKETNFSQKLRNTILFM